MDEKMISTRSKNYSIPNYSLTGDLIAFSKCRLQYRFNNKGALPPSIPVQQWFGEFIHGVMEEAFLIWKKEMKENEKSDFPWSFDKIQGISIEVAKRLKSKGLKPYSNMFCNALEKGNKGRCPDENHPHRLVANMRAYYSVNKWGQYLFPLIQENEVRLQGIRPMPNYDPNVSRANLYGITGVADVISSFNIKKCPASNKLVEFLRENEMISRMIDENQEIQVIIDYKGTDRPEPADPEWEQYEWQILTYMWLQEENMKSTGEVKPIVAGVLLFLDELYPLADTMKALAKMDPEELRKNYHATDVDIAAIRNGESGSLSDDFLLRRSIRIIPYDTEQIDHSLKEFDQVVSDLEKCVLKEMGNSKNVMSCWQCQTYNQKRCTACDLKTICTLTEDKNKPKVP